MASHGKRFARRRGCGGVLIALALTCATAHGAAAQVLSDGPLPPGAVVSDNSFGVAAWVNPNNALASDDTYAVVAPGNMPTQYLKVTNFGFDIPAPAEVLGIEVELERRSAAGSVSDARARIVKNGVVGATDRAKPGFWPTVDTPVTYGSASDLWGETWTAADINANGFGFALSVTDNVDTAAVDAIAITVHYSLCAAAPVVGCRTAQKSILLLKDTGTDAKDKLVWKWIKGQNTSQADFGNPTVSARYALCLYENGTAPLAQALVEPGIGWSQLSAKGWKFLNKAGSQDGMQKIVLKGATGGKAKALVKGKGVNLPDPGPPVTLPVVVQLVNSETGICWESTFSTLADVKKNVTGQFKGVKK